MNLQQKSKVFMKEISMNGQSRNLSKDVGMKKYIQDRKMRNKTKKIQKDRG